MTIYNEVYKSPNYGYPKGSVGRKGHKIIGVGVHITGAEWQSNYNWIMNPAANASYNAMIKRDGTIVSESYHVNKPRFLQARMIV